MRKNKYRHKLEDSAVFPSHLFGSRQSPCQLEVSGRQISPNYIETLQIFFFLLLYSTFFSFPFLFLDKVLLVKSCGEFCFMQSMFRSSHILVFWFFGHFNCLTFYPFFSVLSILPCKL